MTPVYLLVILSWWGWQDAWPILKGDRIAPGSEFYVMLSRGVIVLFAVAFAVLVRVAWTRNGYQDREGFKALEPRAHGRVGHSHFLLNAVDLALAMNEDFDKLKLFGG